MDEKIIQKLEEVARRINYGNYNVKFVAVKGRISKVIITGTEEVVLIDYKFDKRK